MKFPILGLAAMGIEPRTKQGNHTRPLEPSASPGEKGRSWENCPITIVTQWMLSAGWKP